MGDETGREVCLDCFFLFFFCFIKYGSQFTVGSFQVLMKRKLSLSYLNELLHNLLQFYGLFEEGASSLK